MNKAMWISMTGLEAQQTRMSVISNNLANVNTTGFKRGRAVFQDLLYQNVRQAGAQASQETQLPSGLMLGTGVRTVATQQLHTQGNIVQTANSFDLAISGRGFLQVLMPDGTLAYTRDGSLMTDAAGQLVTSSGNLIQPAITVPENAQSLTIGSDGTVSVQVQGQAAPTQIGTIELADFINPTGLQPIGDNLYTETASSGAPTTGTPGINGLGSLVQGALETSNVNVVEELVNMIETQRAYEMNSKAISTSDRMLQYVNNNL
ncbi:flagellar basal-body rod protein FlgG [Thiohalobacter sp. IOR34]|uniref:flagellar basal-body rod protein FlgG n=1 Tax=Thiohalobacter sp. IOR34 TaxID=3057176 RepID=UPI0025B034C2|nr:flagellar basal-body rod protein FlgG [Thiohalobacter sp. IOR34]WJW74609.1 flagellar basal-body rod protein FlgG [Thiohalobacter sp. IOR34]